MSAPAMTENTLRAVWWSFLLQSPLWAFTNGLLPFVLVHLMGASPLELALFVALRPATGLLAPLWTPLGVHSRHHLRLNTASASACGALALLGASVLGGVPAWLCGAALYLTCMRGRQVSVTEILRSELTEPVRLRLLSQQNAVGHLLSALLPPLGGLLLDTFPESWSLMILLGGILCAVSAWVQWKWFPSQAAVLPHAKLRTWLSSWRDVTQDRRFMRYLLGFMATGAGLMVLAPALPSLFMEKMHFSFTQVGLAVSGCKAVGFLLSTNTWVRLHRRLPLSLLNALIALLAAVFPLLLLNTPHILWVGIAYLFYGCMQAGSELSWHSSPLYYAKDRTVVPYAASSQLMVGIRGLIVPACGSWILTSRGEEGVFYIGTVLILLGAAWFVWSFFLERRQAAEATDRCSLGSQDEPM